METDRERRGENSPRPACLTYLEVDASARMRVSCAINRSTRARRPDYLARKSSAINTTSNTSIMVPLVFMKFYFILTTLAGLTAYGHSSVAEEVFLEQPTGIVINESDTAIFRCSVVNNSISIIWLFNNQSAAFKENQDKGVTIVSSSDNPTVSQLEVIGHAHNHNASITCAATIPPHYTRVKSQVVFLTIGSLIGDASSTSHPPEQDMDFSSTAVYHRKQPKSPPMKTPNPLEPKPLKGGEGEKNNNITMYASIGGGVFCLGILAVVMIIFIIVIFRRKRKGGSKIYHKDGEEEMEYNPVYDTVGNGITVHKNELYEMAKPAKFQENHAYDSIGLRKNSCQEEY